MQVELRLFANFREAVGQKCLSLEYDESTTVGEVLRDLEADYPNIELYEDDGNLRGYLNILKNGRDITFLAGEDTVLADGDELSIFPPVAGGGKAVIERSFRGISERAALQYLRGMGAESENGMSVVGDGWRASISGETVMIGPTLELTEVIVRFEGEAETLDSVIETFARKALRAGG